MDSKSLEEASKPSLDGVGNLENGKRPPIKEGTDVGISSDDSNNVVDWDGPEDPKNPMNWSSRLKLTTIFSVVVMCLLTPLASSMFAPGVPDVLKEFHSDSQTLAEFVVSIYILGFAIGPLIISPLSEIYGRRPVYIICNVMFVIFTIACAVANSFTQLIVFRFFAGCFGVCPVTLGGATIADTIPQDRRGSSMAGFGMGSLLGPVIGPICGAFVSARVGWRWTFWVIAIAYGVITIFQGVLCPETYAPVLLSRKTARLQRETGNLALRSALDDGYDKKSRMKIGIVRPLRMLFLSPIILLTSVYVAFMYGILYLLYTTFTFVFEDHYGFSNETVGLTYIANGIGMLTGLVLIGGLSDRYLKSYAAKGDGELKPEYRLVLAIQTCWLVPTGLFIYGWTAQYHIQWAVPLLGTLFFGIGIMGALICIQQYLIDAYTRYAASAIAANTVLRSLVGGLLPLAGLDLYSSLGLGWGNSLIAFIAIGLVPIPFVFYKYGEKVRSKTKVKF